MRCRQADCRAEEIRLTLWRRNTRTERPVRSRSVYSGCSLAAVERLWDALKAANYGRDEVRRRVTAAAGGTVLHLSLIHI